MVKKQSMEKSKPIKTLNRSKNGLSTKSENTLKESILIKLMEGIPLTRICKENDLPSVTKVYSWMSADEDFATKVKTARMNGALTNLEQGFEEMQELSKNKDLSHVDVTLLNTKLYHLRWVASKIIPQFNDKMVNEHKGDISFKIGWDDGNDALSNQPKKV